MWLTRVFPFKNYLMKYFADYMKERVYAINEKTGIGIMVDENGRYNIQKDVDRIPWLSEENGIGFLVEEMTKEEFDDYGKKWEWGGCSRTPNDNESTWRCYKKPIL